MKAKIITKEEYHDRAQNGARILLDIEEEEIHYRVLDGIKEEDESYFIIDLMSEPPIFHLIGIKDCYQLCASELAGVADEFIIEQIEEIIGWVGSNYAKN
jgi:hypothetical protein